MTILEIVARHLKSEHIRGVKIDDEDGGDGCLLINGYIFIDEIIDGEFVMATEPHRHTAIFNPLDPNSLDLALKYARNFAK